MNAVENKIANVSGLVTKTNYNTNISEIENKIFDHNHAKYITTQEFNKLTTKNFKARLKQADLVTKSDFDSQLKKLVTKLLQISLNICLLKLN